MKCWKCKQEMTCVEDSDWKLHEDGEVTRYAEFMCAECRVYVTFGAHDYSECDLEDE